MDNNDWQKKGNDFWNVVQDAVNSGDYRQLNKQVRDTIDDTVEGIRSGMQDAGKEISSGMREAGKGLGSGMRDVGKGFGSNMQDAGKGFGSSMREAGRGLGSGMRGIGNEWRQAWRESGQDYRNRYQKAPQPGYRAGTRRMNQDTEPQLPAIYAKNPPGNISGTVMAITGYSFTGIFAMSAFITGLVMMFNPSFGLEIATSILGAFTLCSLGLGIIGTKVRGRAKRFRSYIRHIGDRGYCTIEELSTRCGRKKKAVIKDLKKMIEMRMFLQGHLDLKETCLIVTDEMYQQYLTVEQQAKEMQQQKARLEEQRALLPEDCQQIIDDGRNYIKYIRECNDDIPGEEISQKLTRLELIITRIFDEVSKNPSLAGDLRKFMNYYLPTTKKLVDAYREMDKETIAGENIDKTKKEIEDTLDTINQAFENLLNSFFEEKAWDISSDISVLHTMLAQEGLTNKDFDTGK
jgi:5-bromo-4-chloroindolyl phosphate hydrolysis protein